MRPNAKILFFAVLDVIGMAALASGAFWLFHRQTLFLRDFPSSFFEALALAVCGIALMFWALSRILRERFARQDLAHQPSTHHLENNEA